MFDMAGSDKNIVAVSEMCIRDREYAVGRAEATVTKINKEKNDERKDY